MTAHPAVDTEGTLGRDEDDQRARAVAVDAGRVLWQIRHGRASWDTIPDRLRAVGLDRVARILDHGPGMRNVVAAELAAAALPEAERADTRHAPHVIAALADEIDRWSNPPAERCTVTGPDGQPCQHPAGPVYGRPGPRAPSSLTPWAVAHTTGPLTAETVVELAAAVIADALEQAAERLTTAADQAARVDARDIAARLRRLAAELAGADQNQVGTRARAPARAAAGGGRRARTRPAAPNSPPSQPQRCPLPIRPRGEPM